MIESFANDSPEESGTEHAEGGRGELEYIPDAPMPENVLDLVVQGDNGATINVAGNSMQQQMDMIDAGSTAG